MSETFTVEGTRGLESSLGTALIHLMTEQVGNKDLVEVFDLKARKGDMEVVVTINGVEVSFRKLLELWEGQLESIVKKAAVKLVEERFQKFEDLFFDLKKTLGRHVMDTFPELDWHGYE